MTRTSKVSDPAIAVDYQAISKSPPSASSLSVTFVFPSSRFFWKRTFAPLYNGLVGHSISVPTRRCSVRYRRSLLDNHHGTPETRPRASKSIR